MEQKEIIEGNKLIAEFMEHHYPKGFYYEPLEMKYHISWNWLMPVVEKCEHIKVCNKGSFAFIISGTLCRWDSHSYIGSTKQEAVYKAVVEFIKWYNNGKQ